MDLVDICADARYNNRQKDCPWKQRTHYGLENGSLYKYIRFTFFSL